MLEYDDIRNTLISGNLISYYSIQSVPVSPKKYECQKYGREKLVWHGGLREVRLYPTTRCSTVHSPATYRTPP